MSRHSRQPTVAVLDYGAANMVSIGQALAAAGARVLVAADPASILEADAIVVPGVGAAGPAMVHLRERGLVEPLEEWVRAGRPCLGICLGYQILFDRSEEGNAETLGLLAGRTERLPNAPTLPHIGWNSVELVRPHPLFDGIESGSHFYFVHTYAPVPVDADLVVATTTHGLPFVSAVARGSLFGLQFHPEKSAEVGQRLLSNFLRLVVSGQAERGAAGAALDAAGAGSGAAGAGAAGVPARAPGAPGNPGLVA